MSIGVTHAQKTDFDSTEPVTFKIMSPDGGQVIGHGEYHLEKVGNSSVLVGRNRYTDGGYDVERDRVMLRGTGQAPAMLAFEHTFYAGDGSKRAFARADVRTGDASCADYQTGREQATHIDFPADTYAGATVVLAMENAVRAGEDNASFHVFDCGPAPRLLSVMVRADGPAQPWGFYPNLVRRVSVTPDLGALGVIISGLIPHRDAWFDASGWKFVGAEIQRYLANGPKVLLVRDLSGKIGADGPG
jgi:hypothetical protein